jgi:serine/threonine-protein kinase
VTGILPFEGESVGDLLVKICTSPAPVPSLTLPGLPPAFDAWFARTMEREPGHRFSSAAELAEALLLSAGMSVRRPTQPSQREPAPYGPVSPTLDSATPLPAAGLTSAPFVTSTQPQRSSRGVLLGVVAAALVGGSVGVFGVVRLLAPSSEAAKSAARASTPPSATAAPVPSPEPSPTEVSPPPATITIGTATPQATATTTPRATGWKTPPGSRPPPLPHPIASTAGTTGAPHPTIGPTNKPPPATADPGY